MDLYDPRGTVTRLVNFHRYNIHSRQLYRKDEKWLMDVTHRNWVWTMQARQNEQAGSQAVTC